MNEEERMDILNRLEAGEIDADEAIKVLDQSNVSQGAHQSTEIPTMPARRQNWWLIPLSLGIAGTAAGLGLSQLGGWWWVCAGPLLAVSLAVVILSAFTSQSPWVHVRVRTGADDGFRKINISLPIPVRMTAWGLRTFGGKFHGLDDTALDDLILGLEDNLSRETPIVIEVHEDEDGEHVEVFMG
jgi:hypothetical protein